MAVVTINIAQAIGSGICVTTQDGQRIYAEIHKQISSGNNVQLSFSSITRLTTAFLNAAVGQLYGEFSAEEIRRRMLPPINAESWQLQRLKLVVDSARKYFENQEKYNNILNSQIGINEDDDN